MSDYPKGAVVPCASQGCGFLVMNAAGGWAHVDTHGQPIDHDAKPKGVTASTPPLVDVIAEVLRGHYVGIDPRNEGLRCECGQAVPTDDAAHQARAVLDALTEANMLRPEPWPPIPYPENAKHQARWTIQRAHDAAWFRTGDHNEGHIAAADALLAEGWTPPRTAVEG